MSLNALVRAVSTTSSLDALLHTKSDSTFGVADFCVIRGQASGLIMPFIFAFTSKNRDVLSISNFIGTRIEHTPIRFSFFAALAADRISLTSVSSFK
ncbi:unnamed protein product [Hymenolepis diminuta]|uniref:Uncharacterized protein n=1 Tax=Hymenolepis diminuta TaxID=6216 RepID=A0A564Y2C4_HYMDI|nr:unnamed protein product [Hymenolepis diminuta]